MDDDITAGCMDLLAMADKGRLLIPVPPGKPYHLY